MVKVLRLKKEQAQAAKEFLQQKGWFATGTMIGRSVQRYVLLPLNEKADEKALLKKFKPASIENRNLQAFPALPGNLKILLRGIVPEKALDELIKSYDTVGDIAVLDIPPKLERFEGQIAHAMKRAYPNLKVIAKKAGKREAIERVLPLKIISGENRLVTMYKEHEVPMKVDLEKVYFSPRASGERFRIAQLVKRNEKVLVMFGGIAPYALVIAKLQPNCKIWSVELNPDAHELAETNVRINRFGHIVTPILGDVLEVVPKIGERFDRTIMPLPNQSWTYLPLALEYSAPSATIHFMVTVKDRELDKVKTKIEETAKKAGKKIEIKNWRLFGSFAPRINRYTFDILVK